MAFTSKKWQEWTNRVLQDNAGNIREFQGTGRDITQNKKAEESLRESERRFRSLSEAAFEGIVFSENGVLVDANEAFTRMYRCSLGELAGKPVMELVAPEDTRITVVDDGVGFDPVEVT